MVQHRWFYTWDIECSFRHFLRFWRSRCSDSTLIEKPSFEGAAALGQVTQEVMTISLLANLKSSDKAITEQVPFQAEPTDLQKILPTNISVIVGIYLVCFPLNHTLSWLDWFSKTPTPTCKFSVTGFPGYKIPAPWIKQTQRSISACPSLEVKNITGVFLFFTLFEHFHSFIWKRVLRVHSITTCGSQELSTSPMWALKNYCFERNEVPATFPVTGWSLALNLKWRERASTICQLWEAFSAH